MHQSCFNGQKTKTFNRDSCLLATTPSPPNQASVTLDSFHAFCNIFEALPFNLGHCVCGDINCTENTFLTTLVALNFTPVSQFWINLASRLGKERHFCPYTLFNAMNCWTRWKSQMLPIWVLIIKPYMSISFCNIYLGRYYILTANDNEVWMLIDII